MMAARRALARWTEAWVDAAAMKQTTRDQEKRNEALRDTSLRLARWVQFVQSLDAGQPVTEAWHERTLGPNPKRVYAHELPVESRLLALAGAAGALQMRNGAEVSVPRSAFLTKGQPSGVCAVVDMRTTWLRRAWNAVTRAGERLRCDAQDAVLPDLVQQWMAMPSAALRARVLRALRCWLAFLAGRGRRNECEGE
jgi:hypothetical protein